MTALVSLGTALFVTGGFCLCFALMGLMVWAEEKWPQEKEDPIAYKGVPEPPKTDRMLWSELDEIDWAEFTQARKRWEMESEFADRISSPKASVHIFPTERKAEWRFDSDEAA